MTDQTTDQPRAAVPGIVVDEAGDERYTVISADCHGGAEVTTYRDYLDPAYRDDFDRWLTTFENPYDDLAGGDADRNWDHTRRLTEMEADGVVAEVLFPNTIPPFFPKSSLVGQPPGSSAGDLERRWAGLQAHNRWLAEFCQMAPGRRAGMAQIMLHDIDASVAEIRWAAEHGLTGGILLPGCPPGSGLPPLYAPDYGPIWSVCEELGMPVNTHSGSTAPDYGDYPESQVMFLLEVTWWAHRVLWHLLFSGVMERHPDLQFVFTEQGTEWVPAELAKLDHYHARMGADTGSQEQRFGAEVVGRMPLRPSEYFARQCHLGSSFMRAHEVPLRHAIGVDTIMWGSDYPHLEGCWPWSALELQLAFAGVDPVEVAAMVGSNAAALYGFDLDALAPLAARFGPRVSDLSVVLPSEDIPEQALRCPAFALAKGGRR